VHGPAQTRLSSYLERAINADTSAYVEHDGKLRDLDFAPLTGRARPGKPVMVIVPVIVLGELDGATRRRV